MAVDIDLDGKVAVVTGAGRGIGQSVAIAMAEAGADVVVAARTTAQLEETAAAVRSKGKKAIVQSTDITQRKAVEALMATAVDQLGGLHILVNNAGTMAPGPLLEQTEEEWDRVIAVNLKAMFLCSQAAGRHMVDQKYGKIINMASTGGIIAGPANASYHASKAAVIHFTKALAIEWIRYNINVNAIAPGTVDTELADEFLQSRTRDVVTKMVPIRRFADCREIADVAVFLASDMASYIIGENVVVDGGLTIP